MLTEPIRIDVQTVAFMQEITDKRGVTAYVFGAVKNMEETMVVTVKETKHNAFMCGKHNLIYGLKENCPECI